VYTFGKIMVLARKNVMVDPHRVRELAKHLGTSESEAIRAAVDGALHWHEVEAAARKLRRRGGIEDVFGRVSADAASRNATSGTA